MRESEAAKDGEELCLNNVKVRVSIESPERIRKRYHDVKVEVGRTIKGNDERQG